MQACSWSLAVCAASCSEPSSGSLPQSLRPPACCRPINAVPPDWQCTRLQTVTYFIPSASKLAIPQRRLIDSHARLAPGARTKKGGGWISNSYPTTILRHRGRFLSPPRSFYNTVGAFCSALPGRCVLVEERVACSSKRARALPLSLARGRFVLERPRRQAFPSSANPRLRERGRS